MVRDVYWFKQIDMPRNRHTRTLFDWGTRALTLAPGARFVKRIPPKAPLF
jgi:hypothetical protein